MLVFLSLDHSLYLESNLLHSFDVAFNMDRIVYFLLSPLQLLLNECQVVFILAVSYNLEAGHCSLTVFLLTNLYLLEVMDVERVLLH